MIAINKIIVPTDFSQNSLRALDLANEFATRFGGEIVLVHILESPIYPTTVFGAGATELPAIRDEMRASVTEQLERIAKEHTPDSVQAATAVREGSPFIEIMALAEEQKADLIVIATHGHTGLKHVLLGSVAEKVVRKAPCPVLTVRVSGEDF